MTAAPAAHAQWSLTVALPGSDRQHRGRPYGTGYLIRTRCGLRGEPGDPAGLTPCPNCASINPEETTR